MNKILNVEIKARYPNAEYLHEKLRELGADYKGCDHQIDTYFNCPNGRLKLRQGNIENSLIFYQRSNLEGPKQSNIALEKLSADSNMKTVLTEALGVKIEVDKKRHIYFIENVKFHVDEVKELGSFMEIEAIDMTGEHGLNKLTQQCEYYMQVLNIEAKNLVTHSYSDMLL
jgi:predicted adenylyl cyclase CyaB